ncbi:SDR family NAD(P)-dependent oxidoreductase [Streptomyces sp. NBC_00841]|uniref:SDR family NAD(P)-dependent oxidoreductase n=1 Tax=Streptomyces sp. NBC_00841 TaxID=2975847 RepID=UPI003FA3AA34
MTTFALVGAGPGLGLVTARRFGAAGHSVALFSRSANHLDDLVAALDGDGVQAGGFAADVLDSASLTAALQAAAEALGPVEILQYSPVPHADRFAGDALTLTSALFTEPASPVPPPATTEESSSSAAPTRRTFIATRTAVGGAMVAGGVIGGSILSGPEAQAASAAHSSSVSVTVNGSRRTVTVDNRTPWPLPARPPRRPSTCGGAGNVAAVMEEIPADPAPHIGRIHELTGPRSEDGAAMAAEVSAAPGRPVSYTDVPLQDWIDNDLGPLGLPDHVFQHISTMPRLQAGNRYDRKAEGVEQVIGGPP